MIIKACHRDFLCSHKSEIEDVLLMQNINKPEADIVLSELRKQYTPCVINEDLHCTISLRPRVNINLDGIDIIDINFEYNGVSFFYVSYFTDKENKKLREQLSFLQQESVDEIMQLCENVINVATKQFESMVNKNKLNSALDEVKPPELKDKLKGLINKL